MEGVCRELDVLEGPLRLWMRQLPVEPQQVLPGQVLRPVPEPQQRCVITPDGFRVEGRDLDRAYQLVEQLRC